MDEKSPLERAFELARTGRYSSVQAIKRQLFDEGYSTHQIAKSSVFVQLNEIIRNQKNLSSKLPKTDLLKR
jgi:hypothetical protein